MDKQPKATLVAEVITELWLLVLTPHIADSERDRYPMIVLPTRICCRSAMTIKISLAGMCTWAVARAGGATSEFTVFLPLEWIPVRASCSKGL